jgi:thioredoxin-like negative regulator of GroEL
MALAHGQRALARGEYAVAEDQFLRAVYALPAEPEARLGLAEVWLMLGLAQRRDALLERAHEAVAAVLAQGRANDRAATLQRYIEEMLPTKR